MIQVVAAAGLGAVVGLVLGALGGGGAILTVPAMVYLLDVPAQAATTASLVVVGVASATSAVLHARAGAVRWRTALVFVATGIPASLLGTWANRGVDPRLLLTVFATVMLLSAAAMVRGLATRRRDVPGGAPRRAVPAVVVGGTVTGFLTGFLGVGGGFVIVPALVIALGLAMPVAVGTSLVVIALNSVVALVARAGTLAVDWSIVVPFTAGAVLASALGRPITSRLPARVLQGAFAGLLVVVAVAVLLDSTGVIG